jgi:hypothetical protein
MKNKKLNSGTAEIAKPKNGKAATSNGAKGGTKDKSWRWIDCAKYASR